VWNQTKTKNQTNELRNIWGGNSPNPNSKTPGERSRSRGKAEVKPQWNVTTSTGRPVDIKTALSNPSAHNIQIGNTVCSVEVAVRQGLITPEGAESEKQTVEVKPAEPSSPYVSDQGKAFLSWAEKKAGSPIFRNVLAKAVVASVSDRSKAEGAISAFADAIGAEPDKAEAAINTLIVDTMETVETKLVDKLGGDAAQNVIDFFLDSMDGHVKANLMLRLIEGQPSAFSELIQRAITKARF
jgi:hypothetical protein